MTRAGAFFLGLVAATGLACAQEGAPTPQPIAVVGLEVGPTAGPMAPPAERPRGIYIVVPPNPDEPSPRIGPGPQHRIIYMNRNGGTYSSGWDNSSSNVSSVPSGTATVSAWSYGDAAWQQLMACTRAMYSRWDVEITDVDPGAVAHIESVVGGTPGQVGLPNGVGGVSPVNGDCSVVERAVVYTFSAVYGGDVQSICETVAQETGHALGMDHEYLCEDPMTYLYGCGAKTFQNIDASCGENGPRTCMCGGSTQNSVTHLNAVLGPADSIAPDVDIISPANGATVMAGFDVQASASDNQAITKIDLIIDGTPSGTVTAAPYVFDTPATLAPGAHTVLVRAYDGAGNVTPDEITVNLAAPPECTTDAECDPSEHCEGGTCVDDDAPPPPPPAGGVGSPCDSADDCDSGMCASDGATQVCTASCSDDSQCPAGFTCQGTTGGGSVCWPGGTANADPEGPPTVIGGCTVGGPGGGGALLVLFGVVALLVRRRR